MKKSIWRERLTLLFFAFGLIAAHAPSADVRAASSSSAAGTRSARRQLGTVTGTVRDQRGQPLAGALIQLLRDGARQLVKETRSAADGSFAARVAPGRYVLSAVAEGFNSYSYAAFEVRPSAELSYRFNLEPLGQGRTAPEQRVDRDDPKWRIRSTQSRRSIFQAGEGDDSVVSTVEARTGDDKTVVANETENAGEVTMAESTVTDENLSSVKERQATHGVVETYAASSSNPRVPFAVGTNFAISTPAGERFDLIFAGQLGTNALARLETTARVRVGARHRISTTVGGASLPLLLSARAGANPTTALQQLSLRGVDEWVVRNGVVVVLGFDYARFLGPRGADSLTPRFGVRYDADARTRLQFAYAPHNDDARAAQASADFEGDVVVFPDTNERTVASAGGRAVMERSQRLEFGVERVLDGRSSLEASVFFDTTDGRGVGLLSAPVSGFTNDNGAALLSVANQQGAARGLRLVYARRLNRFMSASAGYAWGRGQRLNAEAIAALVGTNGGSTSPANLFRDGFFQTVAAQIESDFGKGTRVRTMLRFSPRASVFAIDPFAGRLAVFDPSLSILVTQDLPTFGLPLRAEAVFDARNLLDVQSGVDDGDTLTALNAARRSVRGGISVRF